MNRAATHERRHVTHSFGGVLNLLAWVCLALIVMRLWLWADYRSRHLPAVSGGEFSQAIVNLGLESRMVADRNGNILACSPTAAEAAGYTPYELIGKPSAILMPDNYKPRHLAAFRKAMADESLSNHVNIVRCDLLKKDGTTREVEVIVRIVNTPEWGKVAVVTITPVELIKFTPSDRQHKDSLSFRGGTP